MSGTVSNESRVNSAIEPPWRGEAADAYGRAGGPNSDIQAFEAAIEDLLAALRSQQGSGGGTDASPSDTMPVSAMATSTPSTSTPSTGTPSTGSIPSSTPPSTPTPSGSTATSTTTGANDPSGGQVANIDGGNVDGVGVVEKVDNNTGAAAKFGWENSSGQLVGVLNLQNGQSGEFDVNAAGPDGKSARLIELNPDGTIPAQSNLDEQNVTLDPNGTIQNSPDVSEITAGSDPTKITITDGNGKTVGNGAPGGAYWYPTEDQQTNPADNPMTMAMDTSNFYNNDFTD